MEADYDQLLSLWRQKFPDETLGRLGQHLHFGMDCDLSDMISHDLPELDERAEKHLLETSGKNEVEQAGFEDLLHPVIVKSSLKAYQDGHLRESVLNSVVAVFQMIRNLTGLDLDGDALINEALSLGHPLLVLSNLDTESGRNDQKGFIQIYKGVFQGVRNPKSHTLDHDLTSVKAAQYLVFSSLLARRIEEATEAKPSFL